ncbi:hypothetical protein N7530_006304 [Penicillium desertorum]|uniref:Uncharacterized protein n=1 Tax=Penicillium desertorum TaxID=1303715 RepID=A0A9W9WRI0_9EURO|nr:hypothetical protein N7530_006304 [Penicillium desertorum]
MTASAKVVLVTFLAIALGYYKIYIQDAIELSPGAERTIQPLEDFPDGRKLYAACANPIARVAWSPGGNSYDLQGRAAGGGRIDHITVLDIDQPGADGLYSVRALNFRDNEGNIFAATIT